jgi:hypothetical protein
MIWLVFLNDGRCVEIECEGNPTSHPAFYGRISRVETVSPLC